MTQLGKWINCTYLPSLSVIGMHESNTIQYLCKYCLALVNSCKISPLSWSCQSIWKVLLSCLEMRSTQKWCYADVQQKARRLYKQVLNLNSWGTQGPRKKGSYVDLWQYASRLFTKFLNSSSRRIWGKRGWCRPEMVSKSII